MYEIKNISKNKNCHQGFAAQYKTIFKKPTTHFKTKKTQEGYFDENRRSVKMHF
jgi:hypothetical protein